MRAAPSGSCACRRAIAAATVGRALSWACATAAIAAHRTSTDRERLDIGSPLANVAKDRSGRLSKDCAEQQTAGGRGRRTERPAEARGEVAVARIAERESQLGEVALAVAET